MAGGPRLITDHSQRGNPNYQERSDIDFYQGPNIQGIMHEFRAQNQGIIGDDVNYSPTTTDDILIPHHAIIRVTGTGRASNAGVPMPDETAYIPAWSVGDPR